jgi:hypothetical protein
MAGKGGAEGGIYRSILLWIFRKGTQDPASGDLLFTQADLRKAAEELNLEVRNFPDLTYNLRSRSPLPPEIIQAGYTAIAIRGRGKYALVTAEEKVEVPPGTQVAEVSTRRIPTAIRDILRADEQSILSAMRYLDIVSDFVGTKAYHLQGHLRTSGSLGQQVEADDVWVARYPNKSRMIVPIEAKGPKERIGRHQMMSTIDAVRQKIPNFQVVHLAVRLEESGLLVVIEFGYQIGAETISGIAPTKFKRYRFIPKLPLWP